MFSGIVERTVTLTDIRIEQQNKTFTFRADFYERESLTPMAWALDK